MATLSELAHHPSSQSRVGLVLVVSPITSAFSG